MGHKKCFTYFNPKRQHAVLTLKMRLNHPNQVTLKSTHNYHYE